MLRASSRPDRICRPKTSWRPTGHSPARLICSKPVCPVCSRSGTSAVETSSASHRRLAKDRLRSPLYISLERVESSLEGGPSQVVVHIRSELSADFHPERVLSGSNATLRPDRADPRAPSDAFATVTAFPLHVRFAIDVVRGTVWSPSRAVRSSTCVVQLQEFSTATLAVVATTALSVWAKDAERDLQRLKRRSPCCPTPKTQVLAVIRTAAAAV